MDHLAPPLLFPDVLPADGIVSWTKAARLLRSRPVHTREHLQKAARRALSTHLPKDQLASLDYSDHAIADGLTLLGVAVLRDLRVVVCNPGDEIALEIVPEMLLGGAYRHLPPIPLVILGRFEISDDVHGPGHVESKYRGSPLYVFRDELQKALPVAPTTLEATAKKITTDVKNGGTKIRSTEFQEEILKQQPFASQRAIAKLWKAMPSDVKYGGRPSEALE